MNAMERFEPRQAFDSDVATPCAWTVWDNELHGSLTWRDLATVGHHIPSWSVPDAPALLESQQAAWQAAGAFMESLGRR